MKKHFATLFAVCCLGTILCFSVGHAQQPTNEHANYILGFVGVADTSQVIWFLNQEGTKNAFAPNEISDFATGQVYKSLDSPSLLTWVSQLPEGTMISYMPSSLPKLGFIFSRKGYHDPEEGISAFRTFCQSKGVIFEDRFPVL